MLLPLLPDSVQSNKKHGRVADGRTYGKSWRLPTPEVVQRGAADDSNAAGADIGLPKMLASYPTFTPVA
jgi:hypothetical protein